jgi:hypothetical protein
MTRTEAFVISSAVALAMLPRVESKVQAYIGAHRTEIQIALNELQGKQPIPFAAPDALPAPEAAPQALPPDAQLAMDVVPPLPPQAAIRIEMARVRPAMIAARRAQIKAAKIEGLQSLQNLHVMMAKQKAVFEVYRAIAKQCPKTPTVPAAPNVETVSIVSSSF